MSTHLNYDNGHCEATAGTIRVENGVNEVKHLNMDGNHNTVIPSAIFLTFEQIKKLAVSKVDVEVLDSLGEIRIGQDAPTQSKDGEFFIYFKHCPDEFDKPFGSSSEAREANLTAGKLMAVFFYQVVKNTLQYNGQVLPAGVRNNLALRIGCPATDKWTSPQNMEKYAQLVRTATGIQNVSIVPESRAAMFSAIGAQNRCISAADGVMVFDFGSSTADCTYMLMGRQIMEYSWDLGASHIEQLLLLSALEKAMQETPTVSAGKSLNQMLRDLRMAKERFYQSGDTSKVACTFVTEDGDEVDVLMRVDEKTMKKITESDSISISADSVAYKKGSWQALCREFMQKGKQYLEDHELPCQTVVLTGGASHMNFIETLCREVFGKAVTIVRDKNPSYCVSTGLSWVAIADENHDACIAEAEKLLREDTTCSYATLKSDIQKNLCTYVFALMQEEANKWAKLPGEHSVEELETAIHNKMQTEEEKAAIQIIVTRAVDRWVENFKKGATKAINAQSKKIFSQNIAAELLISDGVWKRLDANAIVIDFDPEQIIAQLDIASMTNKIIQEIVFYATAIAVAIILSPIPFLNYLIGWIVGFIAMGLVSDTDKKKLRNEKARKKIGEQMPDILKNDEIVNKFKDSISDAMGSLEEKYASMVTDTISVAIDMVMLRRFRE